MNDVGSWVAFDGLLGVCLSRREDYSSEALNDAITTLPGLDPKIRANYSKFSGYIDVYPAHNRSIFYWFIESLNDPTHDPIAVWTNLESCNCHLSERE